MTILQETRNRLHQAIPKTASSSCDANHLVWHHIDTYGEGATFFVDWEVRPLSSADSVWLAEMTITPELPGVAKTDYIVQAREPEGPIPANLGLNGISGHADIPPGTVVHIFMIGNVQVGEDPFRYFCFEKTVVSGE